ncbi:acyltransferase-like protein [Pasteurella langaaensis DSM 22999]|uniref:Acyltransferase-like protein n=1 Tax=Alitibacter langaaensis DSM 22999 TaxID=1122935 RepID=A0A2U0SK31_9PAST|nr:acyltransferase-like protein [Pasteurella langaaensis DSM 22999]
MNQRIFWLDAARAIAIVLVVFTHIHERVGIDNYLLKSLFYNIDRLGVPIFFMLSGGLILPRLVTIDYGTFYKRRIPQFLGGAHLLFSIDNYHKSLSINRRFLFCIKVLDF